MAVGAVVVGTLDAVLVLLEGVGFALVAPSDPIEKVKGCGAEAVVLTAGTGKPLTPVP